jgi:hypothetical protein
MDGTPVYAERIGPAKHERLVLASGENWLSDSEKLLLASDTWVSLADHR